ncbi:tRNA threonylcarbamoyladenosine biosynthesis protein TsaB [Paenibacillus plantiphilus]|uniref:tRNA threonylcarbamoyladenosine biosynthesis protein TsaB n=1 Tax=Paenibacillus plantiphilus TaxID=2905650 RepID=A0ABN8H6G2_9BACL|nr:tRNA (adenosine(37)-N6)-threonylcarbamoyltransferase complex dimerization subunit type 1 TsaB [Paenibacillus plantiphilus]CAH1224066.1 tRNA threonylcarbamoyladenosine biosynthesis protein TsaB [Paenibacillus plantiphilus]
MMEAKVETDQKSGPLVLALDTSTAALAAALVRDGVTLGAIQSLAERNHSVLTVAQLKTLMLECGVASDELDGIAVGRGPGSYTGMRIAVTIGKTLAWIWNKPLVGISSLEALAYGACQASKQEAALQPSTGGTDWFVPIMDARRGQVYTSAFRCSEDGEWSRLSVDGIRLMREWVDQLAELSASSGDGEGEGDGDAPVRIWIVGDLSLHEAEGERLREICERLEPSCDVRLYPYALEGVSLAALGSMRLANGERDDVHAFVPNYTQVTEAEAKLLAKQAGEVNS